MCWSLTCSRLTTRRSLRKWPTSCCAPKGSKRFSAVANTPARGFWRCAAVTNRFNAGHLIKEVTAGFRISRRPWPDRRRPDPPPAGRLAPIARICTVNWWAVLLAALGKGNYPPRPCSPPEGHAAWLTAHRGRLTPLPHRRYKRAPCVLPLPSHPGSSSSPVCWSVHPLMPPSRSAVTAAQPSLSRMSISATG